jgi:hypothetical protein
MDPITRMAQEFMKSWLHFRQSGKARLFRIDTDPSMHQDLWRLFRAIEMAPDNRSPYLMFNGSFTNRRDFYRGAVKKFAADYEFLREGFGKDGICIRELKVPAEDQADPEEWFVRVVNAMWDRVSSQFEYLLIIFLPNKIGTKVDWPKTLERLVALFSSSNVRIAAADTSDAMLATLCARLGKQTLGGRFFVPSSVIQEYLFKVAAGGWGAVAGNKNAPTEATTNPVSVGASSRASGPAEAAPVPGRILPPNEAARLRICMAKAATAAAEQRMEDGIRALREAQAICKANELATHEAIMLMAIGNSLLARKEIDQALIPYQEAIVIAERVPAPVVAMQARLGMAAALFHAGSYDRAAPAYEQAAEAALSAESEMMRIEALRMAGTCHSAQGRFDDAVRCWSHALEAGVHTRPPEVNVGTLSQVGQDLVKLYETRGLAAQARSVRQQIDAIRQGAPSDGEGTDRPPGSVS